MSYDVSTPVGKVRLLIQDTGSLLFTDAEVQSVLDDSNGDVGTTAVSLMRALSRRYALKGKEQIGDYSYDWSLQGKAVADMADALAEQLGLEDEDIEIGIVGGKCFLNF